MKKAPIEETKKGLAEPAEPCKTHEELVENRRKIELLKSSEIRVQFFDRGCVVCVGYKSFAFEIVVAAMAFVKQYTEDPATVAKAYGFDEHI